MKIKKIEIHNFRLFDSDGIQIDNINIPNENDEGSGLTVFIGENGCGKTTILDAIALPLLSYKAESFSIRDFNKPEEKSLINLYTDTNFTFKSTMPNSTQYYGKGFLFDAGIRARSNKTYLSSIVVQDQRFIRADGEVKPKDGSPDLRINVNNPYSGPRFNENDILYLDKNRTFQTRGGVYNATRFDRLMEDLDFQYINSHKKLSELSNINDELDNNIKTKVSHEFLEKAIETFRKISGTSLSLNFIDNWLPFKEAFFADKKNDNILIPLSGLGSGYEIIFSLIYSFYLSGQSKKQLISLIDEPELHLHPELQLKFVDFLLVASKKAQIILTTHSPLFVKQLLRNDNVKIFVCKKENDNLKISSLSHRILPYISANEVNYTAFNLPTEEYHNELYGYLQDIAMEEDFNNAKEKNFDNWLDNKGLKKVKQWKKLFKGTLKEPEDQTLPTYIRNTIHHPENRNNDPFTIKELRQSIDNMIDIVNKLYK